MTATDNLDGVIPAVRAALAVGMALAAAIAIGGCSENCTLDSVPAVEVGLTVRDGTPIVEVFHSTTTEGRVLGPLPCNTQPCDRLVVYAGVEPESDFAFTLEVFSPAFVPITREYAIDSDGCHPITQQDALVLDWRPSEEVCAPFCANAVACETDVPWSSEQECVEACVADIADPPPDACVPLYRGLYACLGAGTCDDYLAYRDEVPGHRCEAHLVAINECESGE